ncbi:PDZ domain-containing protein [bacterium]|nr:MAG: PDZ domain-containing protein [bacterium]
MRNPMRFSVAAAALLVLATAPRAQTIDNNPEVKKEVLEAVTTMVTKRAFVPGIDFSKWPEFLDAQKSKLDEATNDEEFGQAVNQALRKFGASHIVFGTPKSADLRKNGTTVGIGISSQPVDEGIMIIRLVPDGSAAKAGIIPGDIITKVDGKAVNGIAGIPGPEGTRVKLTVKHKSGDSTEYDLVRKKFSTRRQEEITMIDDKTAKISVFTFDLSYDAKRVETLVSKVKDKPYLILDLRDNGGGAVTNLQHLLSLFVGSEVPVGTFITKRAARMYEEETKGDVTDIFKIAEWYPSKLKPMPRKEGPAFTGKVAVLINGGSGSASEICAAALKDTIDAKVIGTKSAGAVLVSVIAPATNGFTLQYPLSDYVTIKGRRLEGNGVVPDVEADEPRFRLPDVPDDAVGKAVQALKAA